MLDEHREPTAESPDEDQSDGTAKAPVRVRRRAASRPAGPPAPEAADGRPDATATEVPPPARRRSRKKAAAAPPAASEENLTPTDPAPAADSDAGPMTAGPEAAEDTTAPAKKTTARRASRKKPVVEGLPPVTDADADAGADAGAVDGAADGAVDGAEKSRQAAPELFSAAERPTRTRRRSSRSTGEPATTSTPDHAEAAEADGGPAPVGAPPPPVAAVPLFQPPDTSTPRRRTRKRADPAPGALTDTADTAEAVEAVEAGGPDGADTSGGDDDTGPRRRRRRGGRRRRKSGDTGEAPDGVESSTEVATEAATEDATSIDVKSADADGDTPPTAEAEDDAEGSASSTRRRRRRRRKGEPSDPVEDDPDNTVVKVRERKKAESEITGVEGSTRLEAKKQRRREGREAGRRRPPILSESEFLARRESVVRQMVIRQRADLIQIAVLEDGVLVEHYVARESQTSIIGNVYLGRVQNVLPSMEAAFIDIGKGRNAVLYAGEVDWVALGRDGKPRRIEEALSSGQHVLVQATKDPVGQKGARLTGQISLPGRFLVYVPNGHTSGISRKLPEGERARLKGLLKDVLPDNAGVIIRTAAEGATEEQLLRDVGALTARWEDISSKAKDKGQGPKTLYGEPDLMIKVVRDLFTEDFSSLVVQGDDAWDNIQGYVGHVAPDLADRCTRYEGDGDAFAEYRVDEQIAKALDRKVFLPSGGSLVIDRTEAMTVVDVNTGKFTGSGGNLEETVTKNNLEAAEEMVRQLRLRDIGGIIVIDFIDMVLESNRDLVLRRMVECLSRDRTRHQVAEVTSLGLVQMTRKKIGTGLLEAFSEPCETCGGRGLLVRTEPVEPSQDGADSEADSGRRGSRRRGGRAPRGAADAPPPVDADAPVGDDSTDAAVSADAGAEIGAGADAATVVQDETKPSAQVKQPAPVPLEPPTPRPTLTQPQLQSLPEAITPKKKTPRKRATRKTAPPATAAEPADLSEPPVQEA